MMSLNKKVLWLLLCFPTMIFAERLTHPGTGTPTEGWDGPGQGSVTINWYLGWNPDNPACAIAPNGVTSHNGLTFNQVEQQVKAALATWESAADIRFNKVGDSTLPGSGCIAAPNATNVFNCDDNEDTFQINIYWGSGEHCHGADSLWVFDGRWNPSTGNGFVFGHAWGPYDILGGWGNDFGGNVHLDGDEFWVTSNPSNFEGQWPVTATSANVDIQTEVLHEVGHSLGLAHNSQTNSVMNALKWDLLRRNLTLYDIDELRTLYRAPRQHPGIVLLFDLSGSMSWGYDGSRSVADAEKRITLARNAAEPLLALLNAHGQNVAEFAIADFKSDSNGCDGHTHSGMTLANDASISSAANTISNMTTSGNTPLLAGINHAVSLFKNDQDRRAIVLLTDGYHNCPDAVTAQDQAVTDVITELNNQNIILYPVGFGRPEDFDSPLLTRLATDTTGDFHPVTDNNFAPNNWNATTALQNAYKSILTDALGLTVGVDPLATIQAGQTHTHDVQLTDADNRVSFFVSWESANGKLINIGLTSSDGQPVPSNANGINIQGGNNYRIITVSRDFLNTAGKVSNTPWKLNIQAPGLTQGQSEKYQYSVLMDSTIQLRPHMQDATSVTGDTIKLQAAVVDNNRPLTGLTDVYVTVTRPEESIGNWHAQHQVDINEAIKALKIKPEHKLPPIAVRAMYLTQVKKATFPSYSRESKIRLYDDGTHGDELANDGYYTNTYSNTQKPGAYTFYFEAKGKTRDNKVFTREAREQTEVRPELSGSDSVMTLTPTGNTSVLTFTPKDKLGNYFGPGYASLVSVSVNDKPSSANVIDNLDGSYTQTVDIGSDNNPQVIVKFGDIETSMHVSVIPQQPSIAWWCILLAIIALILLILLIRKKADH